MTEFYEKPVSRDIGGVCNIFLVRRGNRVWIGVVTYLRVAFIFLGGP